MESLCDKVIEYNQDRKLVMVEYPGIVKNVDKMLQTLGGMKSLQQKYRSPDKRIDLRFRPDDPCCHPVCGDRTPAKSLLLRVRKYRRKKNKNSQAQDEFRYIPEIVGIIETAYSFNTLCDFQYLPLSNSTETGGLINMIPDLTVNDLSGDIFTKPAPLFIPPPTFSRFDLPQDILFNLPKNYKQRRDGQPDMISTARPKRPHNAICVRYEIKQVPDSPSQMALETLDKSLVSESLITGTKKLFEERPIWIKNALVCILKTTHDRLKNILPVVSYLFTSGPWRSLWVKFGYDPRNDPDAARLQLLSFHVRKGLNNPNIPIKVKRSTLNYRMYNLKPRGKSSQGGVSSLQEQNSPEKVTDPTHTEAVYRYMPGVLPVYRQTFYQMCDIHLARVEEILKQHYENPVTSTCHEKFGWLDEKTYALIRNLLTKDVFETISTKNQIRMAGKEASNKKSKKRRPKVTLTSEDLKNATPSEYVDSFHRWGTQSVSSSDEDGLYDEIREDITFEYPEDELDENDESIAGKTAEDMLPSEDDEEIDIDEFMAEFAAEISGADDME